ncbi:acyl-CoA reductase [Flagellimonas meridianipacifica]|uniref:Acyl-CoA reductase LuxC n=1 Tax=Flagellimonas meridianipacifica TaxID=1080225 RepID=A0A2T0MC59_9FLAO|nr:acyl-CoA reductase [Allomuricauda pacifica]PRX55083.1 acyl-CoA reductase LuxC [Allomuricauda pacifica]
MEQSSTLQAFVKLGSFLFNYLVEKNNPNTGPFQDFKGVLLKAEAQNSWFTPENLEFSIQQWANMLTENNLNKWLEVYDSTSKKKPKTVAIIMAGNIPLVGFHDFLCVLLSGNKVLVKLSSNDRLLLPFLTEILVANAPYLKGYIQFTEEKLEGFDAVIATGSNNTSRYFEYYFGKYPNIIRKNRNSVAVLSGNENQDELKALGNDVFRYYGLGCRNVSKLYVPKGYDFDKFYTAIFGFQDIINQNKYANNYDYNKAVYLMSNIKIMDNGFLVLKEDEGFSSPIACLFYEFYEDKSILKKDLKNKSEQIQCIVSKGWFDDEIPFGQTQSPDLNDYADGVDTLDFLLNL